MTRGITICAGVAVIGWSGLASSQVVRAAPDQIAVGDWQLTPMAELRLRGEYRRDLDEENHGTLGQRARLGLEAEHGPLVGRIVVQDARSVDLGGGAHPVVGPAAVALTGAYEGWIEVRSESARPSFVRIGRQAVTWGEGRLLGTADWSPTGRAIDAVRGRLVVGDGAAELLAAALFDPASSASLFAYGELLAARFEWAFDPLFAVDVQALARIAQQNPGDGLDRAIRGQTYTGSLRLYGDGHSWAWAGEGAYQMGHADALGTDRAAWAAAGHVAYTMEGVSLRPSLRIGVAYASGDSGGSTYRAFDPLLADVHVWHGAMDLFAWSNEEEANARVTTVPWADALAAIEYRYARLAQADGPWRTGYLTTLGRAFGNGNAELGLGHEIDVTLRWSPWDTLAFEGGYSLFLPASGARGVLAANGIGRLEPGGAMSISVATHFAYAQASLALP